MRLAGRPYAHIGNMHISTYIALVYAGCLSGIVVATSAVGVAGISDERLALVMVLLVGPTLAGARLLYVVEHLPEFRAQPQLIWRRSEGGLAIYGGLALSLLGSVPLLALTGIPYWRFWDAGVIAMLVGNIFGRVGCLTHGCCAGRRTSGHLGVHLPNAEGKWERRVPSPVLEAVWTAVVLGVVLSVRHRLPIPGLLFASAVCGYAAGRVLLESTREVSAASRVGRKVNFIISGVLIAATACVFAAGFLLQGSR